MFANLFMEMFLSRCKRLLQKVSEAGVSEDPRYLALLLKAHLGLEEFLEASKIGQQLINRKPKQELLLQAYEGRAEALQGLGMYEQAVKHLVAALQMDPDNSSLKNHWKTLKSYMADLDRIRQSIQRGMKEKNYDLVLQFSTEGMSIDRKNKKLLAEMHLARAKAYLKKGNGMEATSAQEVFEKCIQDCNRSAYYDPNNSTDHFYLKLDAMESMEKYTEIIDEV